MDSSLISALPNLSVGVVSVIAILWIVNRFLAELKERDSAFREMEKEFRENILKQLQENSRVMERVIDHINNHNNKKTHE